MVIFVLVHCKLEDKVVDQNLKDDDLKHDDRRALARVTITFQWP